MPNTILKRWNGSAFEELYPKTTVGQISASGTPSATTFLRGDGQWVVPGGGERKSYSSISGTSGAWYDLFTVADGTNGALFVSIQTYAHDDLLFTVGTGYGASGVGTITILNCVYNPSGPYASITGVRIASTGLVQAQLTWSSGPTVDIDVAVYGSGTLPTLSASLTANATSYTIDDTVSITGLQGKIRSENGFVQGSTPIPSGTGTLNELTYWSGANTIGTLTTGTYPSLTELSYIKGLSSAVQTQLNNKAATSHTHSIGYYNSAITSDLDTLFSTGEFGFANTTTGRPEDYGQGINIVNTGTAYNGTSNWITQLAFGTAGSTSYFRTKVNTGAWTAWRKLWNDANDGTGSGLDADLLDGQHGSYFLDTSGATQTKSGSLTVSGTLTGGTVSSRNYSLNANGVPTSNLGTPTVSEMALFDEQFDNKTAFANIARISAQTSTDGVTWTEYTLTDAQKRGLVGGDAGTNITITYNTTYFRIKLLPGGYVYANALYGYFTTTYHTTAIQIYKKHDSGSYTQHTSSTNQVSGWPGHFYLPFSTIPWLDGGTLGTHFDDIYIVFIPTWNTSYSGSNITLHKLQIWGGYPASKRNIYSTDDLQNVTFPAAVVAPRLFSSIATGTSPLLVTSTTVNTNLNADLLDGNHAAAFALASHTHAIADVTSLQTSLDAKINTSARNAANGVAPLDATSKVPVANLPDFITGAGRGFYLVGTISGAVSLSAASTGLVAQLVALSGGDYENMYGYMWTAAAEVTLTWTDQTTLGPVYQYHVLTPGDEGDSTSPVTLEAGDMIVFTKYSDTAGNGDDQEFTFSVINSSDPRFANYVPLTGGNITGTLNVTSNVGIGTTSPGAKLHIFDANPMLIIQDSETTSASTDSRIRLAESGASNVLNEYVDLRKNGDDFQIDIYNGSTTITPFVVKYAGNVGIGTTAPAVKLHVAGGTRIVGQLNVMGDAETKRVWIDFEDGNDMGTIQVIQDGVSYKNLALQPDGSNVGIGTRTPTYKFHVKTTDTSTTIGANIVGRFETSASNADVSLQLSDGVSTASQISHTAGALHLRTANTTRLSVLSNGNVGIATTTPSEKLEVSGNAKATTFISTQATGTAPFTVASTTAVTNLNADLLDGSHGSAFALLAGATFTGDVYAPRFIASPSSGGSDTAGAWGISDYDDKLSAVRDYITDTYYPIYHSGNKPGVADISATGSPGATTFLRGDGTWANPDVFSYASLATSTSRQDTTYTTFLTSPTMDANSRYEVEVSVIFYKTSTAVARNIEYNIIVNNTTGTPTLQLVGEHSNIGTGSGGMNFYVASTTAATGTTHTTLPSQTGAYTRIFNVKGIVYTGTSTKTISIQDRASATLTGAEVVGSSAGSYIKVRKIN